MRPKIDPTKPATADVQNIEERVDELFNAENVAALYEKEQVKALKSRMISLCKKRAIAAPGDYSATEARLKFAREKIFPERREALRHYVNVRRQEDEIRRYELKPGEIDLLPFMAQVRRQIPVDGTGPGWIGSRDGFGDRTVPMPSSAFGGTKAAISMIENQDEPIIHTSMPAKDYRNLVFDTRAKVLDDIRVNDERLRVFLDEGGRDLTSAEEAGARKRNMALHRASNLAEYFGDKVHKIASWAGKGIISESKAEDDSRYKAYDLKRKEMLANMLWQLGPTPKDHASYLKALQKINEAMANSPDLMDQATFARVQALITKEIENEEGANKKELEELNKRMQQLNNSMLSGLGEHVKKEDEMWKYRVFQAFLILTPIGAFSILGGVFSYIDPLAQLIGPIFDTGSLAHGIGSLASSDVLGPFGEIGHALGIDKATEFLLENVPIVSDFCDVFDFVTDNEIVQGLFSTVAPLISSPLLPLGIAGVYSLFRLGGKGGEFDHALDVSKFRKEQDKLLEAEIEKFKTTREEGPEGLKARTLKFVKERHAIVKDANLDVVTAKLIADMASTKPDEKSAAELAIFKGIKFKVMVTGADGSRKEESLELSQLKEKGVNPSAREIIGILANPANAAAKIECRKKALLFLATKESPENDVFTAKFIAAIAAKPDAAGEEELKKFNAAKFKTTGADGKIIEGTLFELKKSGIDLTAEKVMSMLQESANKDAKEYVLCRRKLEKIDREFVSALAEDLSITTHLTKPEEAHQHLESSIINAEFERVYKMAKSRIPDSSVAGSKVTKLSGAALFDRASSAGMPSTSSPVPVR